MVGKGVIVDFPAAIHKASFRGVWFTIQRSTSELRLQKYMLITNELPFETQKMTLIKVS